MSLFRIPLTVVGRPKNGDGCLSKTRNHVIASISRREDNQSSNNENEDGSPSHRRYLSRVGRLSRTRRRGAHLPAARERSFVDRAHGWPLLLPSSDGRRAARPGEV